MSSDSPTNNSDVPSSNANVEHGNHTNNFYNQYQYNRILCVHCKGTFMQNDDHYLVRCPHCRKFSTTFPRFSKIRGTVFLILALILLAITLGVIFGTLSYVQAGNRGYIALDVFVSIVFLYLFYRSIVYLTMKESITV